MSRRFITRRFIRDMHFLLEISIMKETLNFMDVLCLVYVDGIGDFYFLFIYCLFSSPS
jgi:hypothetical protein